MNGIHKEYIRDFENYMLVVKGRSKNSISVYKGTLNEFFNFIGDYKQVDEITQEILENINKKDGMAYLKWCAEKGNSASTRNRKVISLRVFFDYLDTTEGIHSDIGQLEFAKTSKKIPKYLTESEARELLDVAKISPRDYAIILMFLTCGLRVSEMASLNRTDIQQDNTMVITGKGNKQRKIYLTDDLIAAIQRYQDTREDSEEFMWASNDGKRFAKISIQFMVKRYLSKIGREDCSVHKLRHTFATLMYQSGSADLLQLQQMLGHNDVGTTQIYTHVSDDQLAACVKNNPILRKELKKTPKTSSKPQLKILAS